MATKGFSYDRNKKKRVHKMLKEGCYMDCALTEVNDIDSDVEEID